MTPLLVSPVSFYKVIIGLNLNRCFFGQYYDYHLVTQIEDLFLLQFGCLKQPTMGVSEPQWTKKTGPPMLSFLSMKISHWKPPKMLARHWDFLPFYNLVKWNFLVLVDVVGHPMLS